MAKGAEYTQLNEPPRPAAPCLWFIRLALSFYIYILERRNYELLFGLG